MNILLVNLIAHIKIAMKHKVYTSYAIHNKLVEKTLNKMISLGVIESYTKEKRKGKNYVKFKIKIINGIPMLYDIKVISTPGRSIYAKVGELAKFKSFSYNMLISTNYGLKTYNECLKENIGGLVLFTYT